MVKITYIEFSGAERQLDLLPGQSLMRGAVDNSVQGIVADCGGACACATCHVYVDPDWFDKVGEIGEMEEAMLEEVCDPQPNSRLACQIKISDELDGLVVRVPARQF